MSETIIVVRDGSEIVVVQESIQTVEVNTPGVPGPPGPGVPAGGVTGQVLKKDSDADYDASWQAPGAAPTAAQVEFTPAGNLAADDVQEAIEELDSEKAATVHTHDGGDITTGTVADARIASTIARDSEVTSAIATSEAGQVRDGDTAGGVLSGTYPDPGFAVDMATQAELDAHVNDTADAHDASAVSVVPFGSIAATDVQAALEEIVSEVSGGASALVDLTDVTGGTPNTGEAPVWDGDSFELTDIATQAELDALAATAAAGDAAVQADIDDHIADTSAAHAASAISASSATLSGTGTDVQAVLEELDNLLDDHSSRHEDGGADEISIAGLSGTPAALQAHLDDTSDAHDASAISIADAGNDFTATDVEGALAELQSDAEADAADLAAHLADTTDAHDASAISILDTADDFDATNVEDALAELQTGFETNVSNIVALDGALADHIDDTTDAHDASAISIVDTGDYYTSTDVEGALQEIGAGGIGGGGGGGGAGDTLALYIFAR